MSMKLTKELKNEFNEVLSHKLGLSIDTINERYQKFDALAQSGAIPESDTLYARMRMVGAHLCVLKGDFNTALDLLNQVLELTRKTGDRDCGFHCRNNIALVQKQLGNNFEAIEIWEKLLEEELSPNVRAMYLSNLGIAYTKALKSRQAIDSYFEALDLLQNDNGDGLKADLFNNLGNIHREIGSLNKALLYYKKALKLYQKNSDNRRLALIYNNLCAVYNEMQKLDEAERYGELALKYYEEYLPEYERTAVLNNIAATSTMQKRINKADSYYHKSLKLALKHNDHHMQNMLLNNLAILALNQENYDVALDYARKARTMASERQDRKAEKIAVSTIKDIWHGKRDFSQAYLAQCLEIELERMIEHNNPIAKVAQAEAEHLQKRLRSQVEMYRKQNADLGISNKIIHEKTQELETQNNLLSTTNALLNRIISVIAHDLRGPVAAIDQAAQLIQRTQSSEQQNELIKHLSGTASDTKRLIDELLDIATKYKIGMEDQESRFELMETIRQSISLAEKVAVTKEISILLHSNTEELWVTSSQPRLKMILRNLLANAVKFSHPQSNIRVRVEQDKEKLVISVCDQGVGMTQQQIDLIKAGASYSHFGTKHEKGFGMGLVFVLEAVLQTKAKLDITSESGKGSCFSVIYQLADIHCEYRLVQESRQ